MPTDTNWNDFYQQIQGRDPRPALLDALALFEKEPAPSEPRFAMDLGSGDGTECMVLLQRGWRVLALDGDPAAAHWLEEKVPAQDRPRLQIQISRFEEASLPLVDLVHSSFSLPFCPPEHFPAFWGRVVASVKPGGRFAGQFFGTRDEWAGQPDMTFLTEDQVRALFKDFEIEFFHEKDRQGESARGVKHWHVFTVIARKL